MIFADWTDPVNLLHLIENDVNLDIMGPTRRRSTITTRSRWAFSSNFRLPDGNG